MRMWMVDPKILCKQHLLGEHNELHMFKGTIERGTSIDGYIENNLVEPKMIKARHNELAQELKRRGYEHNSPIESVDLSNLSDEERCATVDYGDAKNELLNRCNDCGEIREVATHVRT